MEAVAKVPGLRFWWQLYVFGPAEIRDALIDRALQAGCEALVLTADAEIYGNREWEARTRAGPKSLSAAAVLECLRHPAWLARGLLARGLPRFANVVDFVPAARRGFFDSAYWIRSQMDRSLSWPTVVEIRRRWPRKLIVKGLLDVRDIVRATDAGADAVAISNHGGRQLDCEVAPLDLLPAAREAVGDRIAILIDGGVRRGSDVLKAIALGADAVFVGRAPLYGVAAAGFTGARRALEILRGEIERDLGLLGVPSMGALEPGLLVHAAASPPPGSR
jgi:(S)-mandelate dehydrogenase